MGKIEADNHYDQVARQSEANYNLHKETARYLKKKHENAMDTIHNYVFGSDLLGNFTCTVQKWYLHEFKSQAGQSTKIKDYWRHMKEINDFILYV